MDIESIQEAYHNHLKAARGRPPIDVEDFVKDVQAQEAESLARIFSRPNSAFTIEPVAPDGWCTFRALARGLGRDFAELVQEMKLYAREYFKDRANTEFLNDAQLCRGLWTRLDPKRSSSVQAFWQSEAADLLIPMMAGFLNNEDPQSVQIRVWNIHDGELQQSKFCYPQGDGQAFGGDCRLAQDQRYRGAL